MPFFFHKKYYNPFQYIFLRRDKTRHLLVPHPRQRNIYIHQYYIYNFHIGHYTSGCIAYIGHSHKFCHHKTYNPLLIKSIANSYLIPRHFFISFQLLYYTCSVFKEIDKLEKEESAFKLLITRNLKHKLQRHNICS